MLAAAPLLDGGQFPMAAACPSSFSSSSRSALSASSRSARVISLAAMAARLRSRCSADLLASRSSRSNSRRATETREFARARSSLNLRMS
jgi:hypothetical protein